jgi:hypothetical protein
MQHSPFMKERPMDNDKLSPTGPEPSPEPVDAIEAAVPHIHIVLPLVAAVLIFMLAFIAITVA